MILPAASNTTLIYHEHLVRQSIALAREARAAGNHPFGALMARGTEILFSAYNTVHTDRDPTAHAETNLVARAVRELALDREHAARRGSSLIKPLAEFAGEYVDHRLVGGFLRETPAR